MLTVLLATRNRVRVLRDVLEAYCRLESPIGGWKLVVVDNGSKDGTAEVIASYRDRLPIHSVAEPRLGKNAALNTGLGLVEGDLVVFTDDDAFPCPDWLHRIRETADNHLEYSIFGGAILPRWEIPPPDWIKWVHLAPVFALTDPARADGPIGPYDLYGPNMAVRANVFEQGIRFDPSIGPCGADYPMGSETEMLLRLARYGHRAWYVAGAVVEHFIRKEQLERRWVLRRAFRHGRGYYRLFISDRYPRRKLWMGIPRYLFRDIPKYAVLAIASYLCFKQESHFRAHYSFNLLRGQAKEAYRIARLQSAQDRGP